ncbi:MAG: ion transporter [Lachnospiraceae bacterium]|nr:ion transporter [Lachnospiraceae bacterium]
MANENGEWIMYGMDWKYSKTLPFLYRISAERMLYLLLKGHETEGNFTVNKRERAYQIIEPTNGEDRLSTLYDYGMIAVIIVSLVPLEFKETTAAFDMIDKLAAAIFIADYLLRLATADLKLKKGKLSFFYYPLTPMALIDLLSIFPTFLPINRGLRLLKIFRLLRSFRVFRAFRMFRYSKSMTIIVNVIRNQRVPLLAVCTLAAAYVLLSALVIFNVEPDTFKTFFEAFYWAMVSLTTVGYGDIYPVSVAGRVVAMLPSLIGIAIVALPEGIITAGYMDELRRNDDNANEEQEN